MGPGRADEGVAQRGVGLGPPQDGRHDARDERRSVFGPLFGARRSIFGPLFGARRRAERPTGGRIGTRL